MKRNIGKVSFFVILINVLIFSTYLVNNNKKNEKEVVSQEVIYASDTEESEEDLITYSLVDDALAWENSDGYQIYRDEDVPDEDVEKLFSRLLRLRNVEGADEFCKAVIWYITTDEATTTMFAVDQPSKTFLVYDGPEYEIYLEQIAMIVQSTVRDDSREEM